MGWVAIGSAVVSAYGSYTASKKQSEAAKKNAQPKTTTSSPYMAERINPLIPYLMSEQQKIYESRMKTYGLKPGDFSPIAAQLAGLDPGYNGLGTYQPGPTSGYNPPVSRAASGLSLPPAVGFNPVEESPPPGFAGPGGSRSDLSTYNRGQRSTEGTEGTGGMGDNRFIEYWK